MPTAAALLCRNCFLPMPLPPAKHPGNVRHLQPWPKDGMPRNFLCPECRHVYEYTPQAARERSLDNMAQDQSHRPGSVVCVEVPCGTKGCAALRLIRIFAGFDAEPHAAAVEALARSTCHDVPCADGHLWNGSIQARTIRDAYFDEEWERD